jgi:hypothetical protein
MPKNKMAIASQMRGWPRLDLAPKTRILCRFMKIPALVAPALGRLTRLSLPQTRKPGLHRRLVILSPFRLEAQRRKVMQNGFCLSNCP